MCARCVCAESVEHGSVYVWEEREEGGSCAVAWCRAVVVSTHCHIVCAVERECRVVCGVSRKPGICKLFQCAIL